MTERKPVMFGMSAIRHSIKPVITLIAVGLILGACSSKRVVQTVDDSADYKSARALPPLKKPSRVVTTVEPSDADVARVEEPNSVSSEASDSNAVPSSELADEGATEVAVGEAAEPVYQTVETSPVLSARVRVEDGDIAVLEVDAEFEPAWEYLTENLQKSDVTVFARNRDAGRFSIGCGGVAADEVVVQKKGGWSFFSRAKSEDLEYCALQAIERKGKTIVSVVNRAGVVVPADNSEKLFERILNN